MLLRKLLWSGIYAGLAALSAMLARRVATRVWRMTMGEDPPHPAMILAKLDSLLERGADVLERFAHDLARKDGYKRQLGEELVEDAAFLRNLTPTKVADRARGKSATEPVTPAQVATQAKETLPPPAPKAPAPPSQKPPRSGPNPFAVIGIAFVAGFAVGRLIAWRSDAYPRH